MKHNVLMNGFYNFTPELAFKTIEEHWKKWDNDVTPKHYIVGISGGVDSSCVAALACKIFGKDRVVGVSLPCDGQFDMWAVDKLFDVLKIKRFTIDIGDMFAKGLQAIENNALEVTDVCKTNMPARLRMTMLYGVAQCLDGVMINTCNRSESVLGNDSFFGDDCGSYAPIARLTKTEVKAIAEWLDLPKELVHKTPIDGLQPLSDEERLGITYAKVDDYIRSTGPISKDEEKLILDMFMKNRFKLDIIKIPCPDFSHYPDVFRANFNV